MADRGLVPHDAAREARYRQSGAWPARTLMQQWQDVADAHPDNEAVVALDGRLTYRELSDSTDLIAANLHAAGVRPGETAVVQVANSVGAVLAWYGLLKAGVIPICTLAAHRHHEVTEISRRAGATIHVVDAAVPNYDMVAFAQDMAARLPQLGRLLTIRGGDGAPGTRLEDLAGNGDPERGRQTVRLLQEGLDPDNAAVLQLSGGTTGTPKLIPRLHHEYWVNAQRYAAFLDWDDTVRVAHILPLLHNAGIVCALHGAHSVGGTAILLPPVPDVFLPVLERERVTDMMTGAPLAPANPAIIRHGTSMRRMTVAGSKPADGMLEELEAAGIWTGQVYGMAEGPFVSHLSGLRPPSACDRSDSAQRSGRDRDPAAAHRGRSRRRTGRGAVLPRPVHPRRLLGRARARSAGVHHGGIPPYRRSCHDQDRGRLHSDIAAARRQD